MHRSAQGHTYLAWAPMHEAEIKKFQDMGQEALQTEVETLEKQITDAEETFNTELKKLQNNYEKLQKDKEEAVETAKGKGLGMMKSVLASLKAGGSGDEKHDEL